MSISKSLISQMSLERKLKLVTSTELFCGAQDEESGLSQFRISDKPLKNVDTVLTQFPCDKALAATFNFSLVNSVYREIAREVSTVNPFACYAVSNSQVDCSDDLFCTANFLRAKVKGLKDSKQPVCLNYEKSDENGRLISDVVSRSNPDFCLVNSLADMAIYNDKSESLLCGVAANTQEAVQHFLNGSSFVFLKEDFFGELLSYLTERVAAFQIAYNDYKSKKLSLSALDCKVRKFEIFDEKILDDACERILIALERMKNAGAKIKSTNGYMSLVSDKRASFDEIYHDKLALEAARESIVLLKNDANILPLVNNEKVAIVGEYAKYIEYQQQFFDNRPTANVVPLEAIKNYDLRVTGFSEGYSSSDNRQNAISSALNLCSQSDCAIVYLCIEHGSDKLPANQSDLIDALYEIGVRIIAVVDSDGVPNLDFTAKCSAVLLTQRGGQENAKAVLDVIVGDVSPSGRLTESCIIKNLNGTKTEYPFGYGLSYSSFVLRNMTVNEQGIGCTVENVGNYDAYATMMLYVENPASERFAQKTLRGVAKVFVQKNDAVRAEISFDSETFCFYDERKKCKRIQAGEYRIILSDDCFEEKLSGSIVLSEFTEKNEAHSLVAEKPNGDVAALNEFIRDEEIYEDKKGLSFGVKLFLAIALALYGNVMCVLFAFFDLVPLTNVVRDYSIIGTVFALINILFGIFVAVISKRRRKRLEVPSIVALTDMVDNIADFQEVCKIKYNKHIVDEPIDVTQIDDEQNDEQESKPYTATFNAADGNINYVKKVTFGELNVDFREYAKCMGLKIDHLSARQLFSAMSISKIVAVDSINKELLPLFCRAVNGYYAGSSVTEAQDNWKSESDLLLRWDGNERVWTDLANTLKFAEQNPEKNCVAVITNVSTVNIQKWFGKILACIDSVSCERELVLSDKFKISLPNNVCYLLVLNESCLSEKFSSGLINSSLQIELNLQAVDSDTELPVPKVVSRMDFDEMLAEAREAYFLPEKVWKKFDELFEAISASERFIFGNKNTIQSERFTSVLLECGADISETLITLLLAKIVPILRLTKMYSQPDGDKFIISMLERLFPDDDLSRVRRTLARKISDVESKSDAVNAADDIVSDDEEKITDGKADDDETKINDSVKDAIEHDSDKMTEVLEDDANAQSVSKVVEEKEAINDDKGETE